MTVSFSELRAKEVIRLCDAENIGCVSDLILDGEKGCIC
jgi:sporulation protein YlmC with PRC-barrel domain